MSDSQIWLSSPHMGESELKFIQDAFDSNWIAPVGENISGFEFDLEFFLGNNSHVAALNSGTSAIHLGLILLNVTSGDEVICQSFTFSASSNPILYQGATPIFVDSEPQTWNLCPIALEEAIVDRISKGTKPKVIIAVHLYGMPFDVESILKISQKYDIPILEDAAESLGSSYKGQRCGTFGDYAAISFNGNKIITTSAGGVLVSKSSEKKAKAIFVATQSRDKAAHYQHSQIGYNYRMSNICAGIGRGQMQVLETRIETRRKNNQFYVDFFKNIAGVTILQEPNLDYFSNHWLTVIQIDATKTNGKTKEDLRLFLETKNIESRPVWKPLHLQPVFCEFPYYGKNICEQFFDSGLCLPSGSNLSENEKNRIIEALNNFFETNFDIKISDKIEENQIEKLLEPKIMVYDKTIFEDKYNSKTILVTGAAGSIGSEIVKKIVTFNPLKIIIVDQAETPMHNLLLELEDFKSKSEIVNSLVDIRNYKGLEQIFRTHKPDIIFHAAAYKHLPILEENPMQGIYANVLGTKNVVDLAVKYKASSFVFISTDKAVNPSSIMGATKRIAEKYIQSLHYDLINNNVKTTKFSITRFGNVFGSNGSVVLNFAAQIEKRKSLTITNPEVSRYFMPISEVCQLILTSEIISKGGELFVFDMGKSIKIVDLAKRMIQRAGLIPEKDIKIEYGELRPGEKLFEELFIENSEIKPTSHPKIRINIDKIQNYNDINIQVLDLVSSNDISDLEIASKIKKIVPEFSSKNIKYKKLDLLQ